MSVTPQSQVQRDKETFTCTFRKVEFSFPPGGFHPKCLASLQSKTYPSIQVTLGMLTINRLGPFATQHTHTCPHKSTKLKTNQAFPVEENIYSSGLTSGVLGALWAFLFSCRRLMTQVGNHISATKEWYYRLCSLPFSPFNFSKTATKCLHTAYDVHHSFLAASRTLLLPARQTAKDPSSTKVCLR